MPVYKDERKKSGKGIWYVYVRYQDWQGNNCQKTKRGFETKREAQEWERQFMLKAKSNVNMSFESFYELYKEDVKPKLKEQTWDMKENVIQTKILPFFGKLKMSEITARDVVKWQNEVRSMTNKKGEPLSESYLKTIHNQLSAIFNHAVTYYDLPTNPARKAGAMESDKNVKKEIWQEDEYRKVAEELMEEPIFYYAFEVLFWTGAREGEVLALTPEDFDLDNYTMRINKSYHRAKGRDIITTPKTIKSNRTIRISKFLADEMRDCFKMFYDMKPTDRIFQGISKSSLTKKKNKACRIAGVKQIKIHEMRHSHASMLTNMGFPDNAVAERMGHETIQMTQHYSHAYPQRQDEMAKELENIRKEQKDDCENK